MKNYLLTIVIPTYNRCDDLRTCLSCVIPQVIPFCDKVHIYISDNASTDSTKKIVEQEQAKYPDIITYHCQPENLTASPNFNHAVHCVNSEYVYMLSDDDIIVPGFVNIMLGYITQHPDIQWFYLNQYVADNEMRGLYLFNRDIKNYGLVIYKNGGDLLKEYLDGPSCISSNLFKREVWIDGAKNGNINIPGFQWFSVLLHGAVKVKSACVEYPMFTARMPEQCNYASNSQWYFIRGLGELFEIIDKYVDGLSETWVQIQQRTKWRRFYMMLLSTTRYRKIYKGRKKEMCTYIRSSQARCFFKVCLYLIPEWFAMKVMWNMFRALKIFTKI